jgi:hypothetical protein
MDTLIDDFSNPPQWVLDLYDPDNIPPHVLVRQAEEPDTYLIQDVDFHAANLFTACLVDFELPTKGEVTSFTGAPDELYEELMKLDKKVLLEFSQRRIFRDYKEIPMAFGHSSDFSTPALVFADYQSFLSWEKAVEENPEQVGAAYEFINQHPMFWHKRETRRGGVEVVTGRGWDRLDFEVFNKKDKETGEIKTTVTIETGPGNYHDLNLDVYAPSFDAAVIEMAKLIHKHYDSHGGFTDKRKKEPNDNFFREWDKEEETEAEAQ